MISVIHLGALLIKVVWILIFSVVLLWSAIHPADPLTWALEVSPAIIGAGVLALTYNKFTFSPLVYGLILIHCIVLMIGGHYTYAEVPLFNDFKDWFGFSRNNYDKVAHFVQGFVPVLIAREIIIRRNLINGAVWQAFFSVTFCLAFSAGYELIEWLVALLTGENAEAFLGTQGYEWDTQSDMALALLGALIGIVTLQGVQDRQIQAMSHSPDDAPT